MTFDDVLRELPLVAILRGVTPDEVEAVSDALVEAGFRCIEVPLNSPEPLLSIERLRKRLDGQAIVGAGTVLTPEAVDQVAEAGGQIVVSPNSNFDVIRQTRARGLIAFPAFFTPTEAFAALDAGADALKLFPAEGASPKVLKAMRAVLPKATPVFPVGGIEPDNMTPWREAGASGFAIGGALYAPGRSVEDVAARARRFAQASRVLRDAPEQVRGSSG